LVVIEKVDVGFLLGAEYADFIMKRLGDDIFQRCEVLCVVKSHENPSLMITHGSEAKQKIKNAINYINLEIVKAKKVVTAIAEAVAQMNRQKQLNEEEAKQQQIKHDEVLFSDFSEGLDSPTK
jgi:hypothetical protein